MLENFWNKKKIVSIANIWNSATHESPVEIRIVVVKMDNYKCDDVEYLDKNYYIADSYRAPNKMTVAEVSDVVSYASKQFHNEYKDFSIKTGVEKVNNSLVNDFSFVRVQRPHCKGSFSTTQTYNETCEITTSVCAPIKNVIDLFVVTGDKSIFKNSPLYNRFFEWYNPNVEYEDIVKIYGKLGINLDINKNDNIFER